MRSIVSFICFAGALVIAALMQNGEWQGHSFILGFAHPLLGMDHILVMIAVGFWAVLLGGRAVWALPATFLSTMLAGFAAASVGLSVRLVEPAILASVVALGVLVALAVKTRVWLGALITAMFAFFHGHAHGTEAATVGLASYAIGFTLATATLHTIGIGLGILASGSISRVALRTIGGITALIGVALMVI